MRTRKYYFETALIAIFSAVIAIAAYHHLYHKPQIVYNYPNYVRQVSYSDTGQQPIDFTYAAEQTIHAVVHVRTKSKVETTYRNPIYEFFYGDGTITREQPVVGFG